MYKMRRLNHASNYFPDLHRCKYRPHGVRNFAFIVHLGFEILYVSKYCLTLIHLKIRNHLILRTRPVKPITFFLDSLDQQSVGINIVPRNPVVKFYFEEYAAGAQLLQFLLRLPTFWNHEIVFVLGVIISLIRLNHYP